MSINAWAEQLFGPLGCKGNVTYTIAGLPRMPSRHEHVPLVLRQPDYWYGACGAWSCDFLGPARDGEDEAGADAESHRAESAA